MAHETTLERWYVETDGHDWPKGLPMEERGYLTTAVRECLVLRGANGAHLTTVERYVANVAERNDLPMPVFRKAAAWDFRYACIERALRACDAEQRWHLSA